ncbi:hypothetical protein [Clostridium akagii]|uniref:TcpK family conjugal transfer DNA-binding protein n=1 Tax=Clostridium akagii TaxID=91623 RepID=UPI00047B05FD|nr:hypothetical protein [Clostridium akagii]
MTLLDVYFEEYIAIVNHLLTVKIPEESKDPLVKENSIFVSKEVLFSLFSKNPYKKNTDKLICWNKLHLIDSDEGRLTQKVYIDNGPRVRRIVINRKTFELISSLKEKEV